MSEEVKKCDLCLFETKLSQEIVTGPFLKHNDVTVHYYCLLTSTNLLQNGADNSGILGFLLRDIRMQIQKVAKNICIYCQGDHAPISCHTCKAFFHYICGFYNGSLTEFCGEFKSYCNKCLPLTEFQKKCMAEPSLLKKNKRCYICDDLTFLYNPVKILYSPCCETGFVHRLCMQKFALNAGYYLKCIFCKKREFRELIKLQGIFVPDRDAIWEREKEVFADLHKRQRRCDMEPCHSTRERTYNSKKWPIIFCSLCGLTGAHNPACIPGNRSSEPVKEFKCEVCAKVDGRKIDANTSLEEITHNSLYVCKDGIPTDESYIKETPTFSDDESGTSDKTLVTVINLKTRERNSEPMPMELDTQPSQSVPALMDTSAQEADVEGAAMLVQHETQLSSNATTVANVPDQATDVECIDVECNKTFVTETLPMEIDTQPSRSVPALMDTSAQEADVEGAAMSVQHETQLSSNATTVANVPDQVADVECSLIPTQSSAPRADIQENILTFEMFKFKEFRCIGTCIVRINLNEERFKGKTLEEIEQAGLITPSDITEDSEDRGIFEEIEKIILEG